MYCSKVAERIETDFGIKVTLGISYITLRGPRLITVLCFTCNGQIKITVSLYSYLDLTIAILTQNGFHLQFIDCNMDIVWSIYDSFASCSVNC